MANSTPNSEKGGKNVYVEILGLCWDDLCSYSSSLTKGTFRSITQIPKLSCMILNRNINEHLYQHAFLIASYQAIDYSYLEHCASHVLEEWRVTHCINPSLEITQSLHVSCVAEFSLQIISAHLT